MESIEQLLATELANDPLGRGYTTMNDHEASLDLRSVYRTKLVPCNSRQLLEWGASNQRLKNLQDGQSHANADVANLCIAAFELVKREEAEWDPNKPSHVTFIDTLVSAGVLSQPDKDALIAKSTVPISRAEELGVGNPHGGDIGFARSLP